jgi:hypothetical protein
MSLSVQANQDPGDGTQTYNPFKKPPPKPRDSVNKSAAQYPYALTAQQTMGPTIAHSNVPAPIASRTVQPTTNSPQGYASEGVSSYAAPAPQQCLTQLMEDTQPRAPAVTLQPHQDRLAAQTSITRPYAMDASLPVAPWQPARNMNAHYADEDSETQTYVEMHRGCGTFRLDGIRSAAPTHFVAYIAHTRQRVSVAHAQYKEIRRT